MRVLVVEVGDLALLRVDPGVERRVLLERVDRGLAKNGMNESFTPSRLAKSSLTLSRSCEIEVTSTSTTVVSCAEACGT